MEPFNESERLAHPVYLHTRRNQVPLEFRARALPKMIEEDAPDSSKLRALADALFDATDANRDGVITHLELLRALRTNDALRSELGFPSEEEAAARAQRLGRQAASIRAMRFEHLWAEMDQNDDITISRTEFQAWILEHHKVLDAPAAVPAPPPPRDTPICTLFGIRISRC